MNDVIQTLNEQVANWNVLFVKLHNFHWNVKGPSFYALHEKFEELYDEAATHIDEIAERVLALKGKPLGTMKKYLEVSTIKEAMSKECATEMIHCLIDDYQLIIGQSKTGAEVAANSGDDVTEGMLLDIVEELEKHVWMLSAVLG